METNFLENNSLVLMGKVANEKTFSHEIYGEKFYQFSLSVPRLSGNADNIPITISERLFRDEDIAIGKNVKVNGQFRSYNGYENNKNRLVLTVFVKDIEFLPDGDEVLSDKDVVSNEVDKKTSRGSDGGPSRGAVLDNLLKTIEGNWKWN